MHYFSLIVGLICLGDLIHGFAQKTKRDFGWWFLAILLFLVTIFNFWFFFSHLK
jgi:Mg2+ and Co2+ transporter CorA